MRFGHKHHVLRLHSGWLLWAHLTLSYCTCLRLGMRLSLPQVFCSRFCLVIQEVREYFCQSATKVFEMTPPENWRTWTLKRCWASRDRKSESPLFWGLTPVNESNRIPDEGRVWKTVHSSKWMDTFWWLAVHCSSRITTTSSFNGFTFRICSTNWPQKIVAELQTCMPYSNITVIIATIRHLPEDVYINAAWRTRRRRL